MFIIVHLPHLKKFLTDIPLKVNTGISVKSYCFWVMGMMYERIKHLREDRDLKQRELAELLSVGQTTYSDYERGRLNIPVPVLIRLAEFYSTSIDYLVGLTDVPSPYPRGKK